MSTRFELFKIGQELFSTQANTVTKFFINKLIAHSFDSFNISLSSPVSPMPLPEDTAESNILVKMEGNSAQIRFSFKFGEGLVDLLSTDGLLESDLAPNEKTQVDVDVDINGSAHTYTSMVSSTNNILKIKTFLENFENTSITNTYVARIYDTGTSEVLAEYGGSLVSMDCQLDAGSPVVWTVNIDFMIGDVISIYDADTPDPVNNFNVVEVTVPQGQNLKVQYDWTPPDREGGSAITKYVARGYNEERSIDFTIDMTSPTFVNPNYTWDLQSSDFSSGETWIFYMYPVNTGGKGSHSEKIRVKFT